MFVFVQVDRPSCPVVNERSGAARYLAEVRFQQARSCLPDVLQEESATREPVAPERKQQIRDASAVQSCLGVEEVLSIER